ncbi:MAG TPA: TIM-barrel domain-containing protein [Candidatus Acidoferrales bacterium]|jgi:alpha-D-xyloside xylohydrolase|nr:TIM-barrel domain-containing protein [Candidatus Acidoferrales bacterium]
MFCIKLPLRSFGIITFLPFFSAFFFVQPNVRGADDSPGPKTQLVAPGIWRIRFGHPERFTPTHFRTTQIDLAGLKDVTPDASLPFNLREIVFQVSDRGCSVQLPMKKRESIYGFGLHTELFDMTQGKNGPSGRRVVLAPTDMPENDLGESHAPVPFYGSSEGYGIYVDTARFAAFYTGNVTPAGVAATDSNGNEVQTSTADLYRARVQSVKTMLVDVPAAKGVDVYIFAGPTMLDAVERYNLFSGGGAMPPLWGLGVQYRGYARYGAAESLALATRIRDAHIPCDVWGVEPGWQSHSYSCSFVWDTNAFPDPDDFIQKMHAMGYRLNFWEHAFTHPSSPIHDELERWSGNYLVWGGLVPDFASAEGKKIFLKQNDEALFDRGIESVKLDECDFQPESASPWSWPLVTQFPSGLDGELMHSLFGVLYQQTMLEPYAQKGLRTWGLVRDSQALASPLPYALYSDTYSNRCYVRGLVNEGFDGLLWTPEVRIADSLEDFYRRLETVIFSPDAVINSWFIKNPPWDQINRNKNNRNELMPERNAVVGVVRKILQLRMSFVPYLYTAFNEYHSTGKPPIRALVLDWPDDKNVRQIDDEFMFGDSVLVAPMFAGEPSRQVYLPAGDWFDFWTHAKISGPATIEATNETEQIPLFVKGGTLLPLAEPVEFIKPDTCFDITVNEVGDSPAEFTLYEDDGITTGYETGSQNKILLKAGANPLVSSSGNYHGPARYKITAWQEF